MPSTNHHSYQRVLRPLTRSVTFCYEGTDERNERRNKVVWNNVIFVKLARIVNALNKLIKKQSYALLNIFSHLSEFMKDHIVEL